MRLVDTQDKPITKDNGCYKCGSQWRATLSYRLFKYDNGDITSMLVVVCGNC